MHSTLFFLSALPALSAKEHVNLPGWGRALIIAGFVLIIGGALVLAGYAVYLHLKGNDVRVSLGAKKAREVATSRGGRFMASVGRALSGSYSQVQDRHSWSHFVAMNDKFEEFCRAKGIWVPADKEPFASGKNRYLLNYVEIPRPYGNLAAYELRYDDPVVDWHLAMVYDMALDQQAAAGQENEDRQALWNSLSQRVWAQPPQELIVGNHHLLFLIDGLPTKINDHFEALLSLS